MPWFSDNRLHFLAWAEAAPGGRRYGVEVESLVLLSRLAQVLPVPPPAGQTWALLDDSGRVFSQTGPAVVGALTPQLAGVSLGPILPHWQVVAYGSPAGVAGGLRLVSGLLVGTFVAAILFGGTLLLWQARRHLADARRKTSFVSNVSHELKTPLTTIRMYAELLAEDRVREESKVRHYLRVIVAESERLTRLVNNVLDFSRLEQGRKNYVTTVVDLGGVVDGVLETQALRLRDQGMELERRLPAEPTWVRTDRDALEQALLNLLDNALKYAADGKWLGVEVFQGNGSAEVAVSDRGSGIPSAHRRRLFEKFHRVDDSLTARQPGSGLGLSIARQLMRAVGGDVSYRPREGGGATFIIRLPLQEGEP
jgi:signal transduction histidine kinase